MKLDDPSTVGQRSVRHRKKKYSFNFAASRPLQHKLPLARARSIMVCVFSAIPTTWGICSSLADTPNCCPDGVLIRLEALVKQVRFAEGCVL